MKKLVMVFSLFRNWFYAYYRPLLLALLLALISFPKFDLVYWAGNDQSLPWVFNYFALGHYTLARHLLFPHGPLAFLLYPLAVGNNLDLTILITLTCSTWFGFNVFRLYARIKKSNYVTPSVVMLLLLSFSEIQLVILGIVITSLLLHSLTDRTHYLLSAVVFSVFNLYIKSYGGVICLTLLGGNYLYLMVVSKQLKKAMFIPICYLVFFGLIWLALFQSMEGAGTFLYGQYQLSSDNSEAVSYQVLNNWYLLSGCFISLALIPLFLKENLSRHYYLLMVLPLFAAWKHAIARSDYYHIYGFPMFICFFMLLLVLISDEKKIASFVLSTLAISFFILDIGISNYGHIPYQKEVALVKPFNLYNVLVNKDSLLKEKNTFLWNSRSNDVLPDTLLKIIGDESVDAFPWNYAVIPANKLRWLPHPTLHSYAMYTPWIDEQNARHFDSDKAAHFIIWEIGAKQPNMLGIDNRYLLNDGPRTMLSIFARYKLRCKTPNYLLFEKQANQTEFTINTVSEPFAMPFDYWVPVPEAPANSITRVKVRLHKNLYGKLKSSLYKGNAYEIFYEAENGVLHGQKLIPANAVDGLWVNPLIYQAETDSLEPVIKRIKIISNNYDSVDSLVTLQFEQIVFKSAVDFNQRCFQKIKTKAQTISQ